MAKIAKLAIGYTPTDTDVTVIDNNDEQSTDGPVSITDILGVSTGWTYQTTLSFSSTIGSGLNGAATTHFSSSIMNTGYRADSAGAFTISGLDDTKTYNIYTSFSRTGNTGANTTDYTVNSGTAVTLANNDIGSAEAEFLAIAPSSGVITVEVDANASATSYGLINGLYIEESDGPLPPAEVGLATTWKQSGAVVRAKSEIVRKGGTVTFTADYDSATSYVWTIYGAGAAGANITSGSLNTNVWTSPALETYGNYNVKLTLVDDGSTYKGFQERIVNVRPAYTKGSQPNSYTHDISTDGYLAITEDNIVNEWGLSTASPITIIIKGSSGIGFKQLSVDYKATEAAPLLIINEGVVTYSGTANKSIFFAGGSEWIFLDGFGEDENITATGYAPSPTNINPKGYGIVFDTTGGNWNIISSSSESAEHIYVYGIMNRGGGGIAQLKMYSPSGSSDVEDLKPYNWNYIYFHHNYAYDCANEVFYFGDTATQNLSKFVAGTSNDVGIDNSAIYRSDFNNIGRDPFQARFCVNDYNFDIHNNTVVYAANANEKAQSSIFALNDGFAGRIFNNICDYAGNNTTNSCKPWYPLYIYNNIFLNLGNGGDMDTQGTASSVFSCTIIEESVGQTFDPAISIEYYIWNNIFHIKDMTTSRIAAIYNDGAYEFTGTFTVFNLVNNAVISPFSTLDPASRTITNSITNSTIAHNEVASSDWDFVGGSYDSTTDVYNLVGQYDANGDYSIASALLLPTSSLFGTGTNPSTTTGDAPNAGNFPAEGEWTDVFGTVLNGTDWNVGPYAPSDSIQVVGPTSIILADKTQIGLYENVTLDGSTSVNATTYTWDLGDNYTIVSGSLATSSVTLYYSEIGNYAPELTVEDDDTNTASSTSSVTVTVQASDVTTPIYYKIYSSTSSKWIYGVVNSEAEISVTIAPDGSGDTVIATSVELLDHYESTLNVNRLATFENNAAALSYLNIGDMYWDSTGSLKRVI